jgi:hypothetical protein
MTYIAIYKDPDGLPRCWAAAKARQQAINKAGLELDEYRKEKRANGDPLAYANFTIEITETEAK